jgi:hypothetical protein
MIGVRHLATPTTIVDYGLSQVAADNRPHANSGSIGVRQFVPPVEGAVQITGTRSYNRGYVTTDSTYGQVDAWIGEVAWLQTIAPGGKCRVGYRYYREDETTRAFENEQVFGSDTMSVGLSQDVPKEAVDSLPTPVTLELAYARYLTNAGISASSYEFGVSARF